MNTEYWQQWAQAAKKREEELEAELTRLRAAITEFMEADSAISPKKLTKPAKPLVLVKDNERRATA